MKRVIIIILSVLAVLFIIGFAFAGMASRRSLNQSTDSYGVPAMGYGGGGGASTVSPAIAPAPPVTEGIAPAYDSSANAVKSAVGASQGGQDRMVIQTADLAIVVTDPNARMAEISKLATGMGGYVVSSNLYQSYSNAGKQVPEAAIVIRVPAAKLDDALAQIKKGAVDIQSENRSGQDITNVYVDLQAQLNAKEAAAAQLLKIMQDAKKTEDVLAVYMQLQSIQTEIEQLKGQIKYYDEAVALSSISVRLIAEEGTQPIEVGPWKPEGAARQALQDLINFVQNFADFLIRFVIYILPALILIALPILLIFFVGRAIYRRARKPKAVVEERDIENKP